MVARPRDQGLRGGVLSAQAIAPLRGISLKAGTWATPPASEPAVWMAPTILDQH